jgi:tetratricopeptide (TPR) repeat protein
MSTHLRTRSAATVNKRPAPSPSVWILDTVHDLLLFVGTPLVIVPVFFLAQARYSVEAIALFVAAFGACGHHLPGMMRAYGDRELFQRFRVRFIVAPLFLLAVCLVSSWYRLQTLVVVAVLWGFWHGLAQVYGFGRIYDAKVGSTAPLTARLDLALCFTWFGLGMIQSPGRLYGLVNAFYAAGGPLIDPRVIRTVQQAWWLATLFVTAAFAANFIAQHWRGQRQSIIKLLLFASSIGFWWYCMVAINNVILGIALFEVFHDVQYLSIVWVYNRRRVERQAGAAGRFTRFLFRPSGRMIGLYLGLIFAYGALGLVDDDDQFDALQRIAIGFLAFSALLHFYYDGFIWKVRERSTREGLGLQSTATASPARRPVPGWLSHAAMWLLFVVPVGLSAYGEAKGGAGAAERRMNLVAIAPGSPDAQYEAGLAQSKSDPDAAAKHFSAALRLNPGHVKAMYELGNLARLRGDYAAAREHYLSALEQRPDNADARNNLASVLVLQRRPDEARAQLETALRYEPRHAAAHNNLGNLLAALGESAEAINHYRLAIDSDPSFREAYENLASRLTASNQMDQAIAVYRVAAQIEPRWAEPQLQLAMALYQARRGQEALAAFAEAEARAAQGQAVGGLPQAMQAWILATHPDAAVRDPQRAVHMGRQAIQASVPANLKEAYDACAAACAAAGDFAEAVRLEGVAIDLSPSDDQESRAAMHERLELYQRERAYIDPHLRGEP